MSRKPLNNPYLRDLIDTKTILSRAVNYEWEDSHECQLIIDLIVTNYIAELPHSRQVGILNIGMEPLTEVIKDITRQAIKKYGARNKILTN